MASGTIVKNVVEYIVKQIVEDTKSVKVDVADSDDENVTIEVRTSPNDMGRVIGKRGRVARAIRTVAQAAADEEGLQSSVEFID
ncbi:MAG: KH domain-containing protein [Actinomycetota bacterium]|nr:KH domain-containing protein [Actinomycetota bacterium]MDA3008679.1 KH domain-containing protein [Actinomycetota bacterium]MDA3037418.1 KH domain-containing protein [Actinomycetota bacterium]